MKKERRQLWHRAREQFAPLREENPSFLFTARRVRAAAHDNQGALYVFSIRALPANPIDLVGLFAYTAFIPPFVMRGRKDLRL